MSSVFSITTPTAPTNSGARISAAQKLICTPGPSNCGSCVKPIHARNAAIMNWAPCVKLTMLSRPKMMASPMLRMA
ncbi:hypothetical protein D3C71_2107860 [compost metagenome]